MSKHTPGPWDIYVGYVGTFIRAPKNDGFGRIVIAEMSADKAFSQEEVRANAHLIAAAPQLLTVLEAVEWVGDKPYRFCPWCFAGENQEQHYPTCTRQAATKAAKGES